MLARWLETIPDPETNTRLGKHVGDATWRVHTTLQLRSRNVLHGNQQTRDTWHTAVLQLGIMKVFENIGRHKPMQVAILFKHPLHLLRMSLHSCAMQRCLTMEGVLGDDLSPFLALLRGSQQPRTISFCTHCSPY